MKATLHTAQQEVWTLCSM